MFRVIKMAGKSILVLTSMLALTACSSSTGQKSSNEYKSDGIKKGSPTYFRKYAYVNDARTMGNQGFVAILKNDQLAAKSNFFQSTNTLASGIDRHRQIAAKDAEKKQAVNKVATLAIGVGLAYLGARASTSATTTAQYNSAQQLARQSFQSLEKFSNLVSHRIARTQRQTFASGGDHVDADKWRSVVISDHPIARSVVRVRNRTQRTTCTGFFISSNRVATSAHCFRQFDNVEVLQQRFSNGKDYVTGNDLVNPVVSKSIHSGYDGRVCSTYDVAVLTVRRSSSVWLDLAEVPPKVGRDLFVMGYSGDLNQGQFLRIDYGCTVNSYQTGNFMRNNCATYKGNSGGPVLEVGPGKVKAVGINSCGSRLGTRGYNTKGSAWVGLTKGL